MEQKYLAATEFNMKLLVVLIVLVAVLEEITADKCAATRTKRSRYTTKCGFWGWARCVRFRTVTETYYKDCTHGGWSDWRIIEGKCSASCGGGEKVLFQKRTCTNPAPANGGRPCSGSPKSRKTVACNEQPCPVDGGWSDWSEWEDYDECDVLCGGGHKKQWQSRTCTNPKPAHGGAECDGKSKHDQIVACSTKPCGEVCPEGEVAFIRSFTKEQRYYQCSNGVAHLKECPPGTIWDEDITNCKHKEEKPITHAPATGCDVEDGVYQKHPFDCTKFVQCNHGQVIEHSCAAGMRWNHPIKSCDWASNVEC